VSDPVWEVYVYQGPAASTGDGYGALLAVLPGWTSLSVAPLGNAVGAGSVSVPLSSPVFWQQGAPGRAACTPETTPVLAEETLWQARQDGIAVFEFLAQSVDRTTVAADETATVTISGPGTAQCLNWAMAMPFGWTPGDGGFVSCTGAVQDPFTEQDASGNYVLDTVLWSLCTPGAASVVTGEVIASVGSQQYYSGGGGSAKVLLAPGGAYLGGGPFGFANSSFSVAVTAPQLVTTPSPGAPIDGDATNGSDTTQLIIRPATGPGYAMIALSYGSFWCEFEDAAGNVTKYDIGLGLVGGAGAYDSSFGQYWRISCDLAAGGVIQGGTVAPPNYLYRFWTSGDGASWTLRMSVTPRGGANWDPRQVNVYLGGYYNTAGAHGAFAQFGSLNGEISAGADLGPVYVKATAMGIMADQLAQAADRGTIPFIVPTFSAEADSDGEAWSDSWSVQVPVGTDMLTGMTNYAGAVDASWIMLPGYKLTAQLNAGRQLQSTVIFHEGEITQYGRTQTRDQIYNVAATADGSGMIWTENAPASITQWAQRETWVASGGSIDAQSAVNTAQAAIDQWENEVDARVLQIPPNAYGKTVFRDIQVWDWIGVERSDFAQADAMQVIGITVTIDQDGNEAHELVLLTYRQVLAQWFGYLMGKFGGQSAATLGSLSPGTTAGSAFSLATGQSLSQNPQQLGGAGSSKVAMVVPATFLAAIPEIAAGQVPGSGGGPIPGGLIQEGSIPAVAISFSASDIGGVQVFFSPLAPETGELNSGDMWYNTAENNQLNVLNAAGNWVVYQFGTAAIAANAITSTQIAAGSITTPLIAANAITAGQIAADTITANQIAAGTITGDLIAANTITAAQILAGSITTSMLTVNSVLAGVVDATTITAATIIAAVFEGTDWLETSQGEFFYAGTPAHGNLAISIAPAIGSDPEGNPFAAGVGIYGQGAAAGQSINLYTTISNINSGPTLAMGTGMSTEELSSALFAVPYPGSTGSSGLWLRGPSSTYDNKYAAIFMSSSFMGGSNTAYIDLTISDASASIFIGGKPPMVQIVGNTNIGGSITSNSTGHFSGAVSTGALSVNGDLTGTGSVNVQGLIATAAGVSIPGGGNALTTQERPLNNPTEAQINADYNSNPLTAIDALWAWLNNMTNALVNSGILK